MDNSLQRRGKSVKASLIMVTWSPTKERMELLNQTFDSLRKSTTIPYELIVVDNGPKEQTDFLKTQKIDKHIINKTNKGIGYGRNQGLEVAIGDYIAYVDNDLIFAKDWLREGIEALEKYPDRKLIASTLVSQHQVKGNKTMMNNYYYGTLDEYTLWNRGSPGGTIYRKKDSDKLGRWDIYPRPGTKRCNILQKRKYRYISLPFPKVMHRGIYSSYDHVDMFKGNKWKKVWKFK